MNRTTRGCLLVSALLLAILQGCTSQPRSTTDAPTRAADGSPLSEIEQLLLNAEQGTPLVRAQYTLQAAEQLLEQQQLDQAEMLVNSINSMLLPVVREQQYWLLKARIANALMRPEESLESLARIIHPLLLAADQQQLLIELRAINQTMLGDSTASLNSLIERSAMATGTEQAGTEQRTVLNNIIWSILQTISKSDLLLLAQQTENNYLQQGWYELALVAREHADILNSTQSLLSWQQLWSQHPAATTLPDDLAQILRYQASTLAHIAVLLPQSGKLARPAQTIIEGLLAAHYQDQRLGRNTPRLSFFDSTQINDLAAFYQRTLIPLRVNLVIGPLSKNQVYSLTQAVKLPIPTLALNYSDEQSTTLNLYQFGLKGEDEARLVAQRAWNDGHRNALSLTPETSWGYRIQQAFEEQWIRLGGLMVATERFSGNKDFSERISSLLGIDDSEQRYATLRKFMGEKVEFEARRRQDVDFIFLSALAKDARQIKPTLAFHYASDLPVYATSHVYSGVPAQNKDRDLNGVRFSSIPWMLSKDNPLKAELDLYRNNVNTRFGRLYALGVDAYRIAPYLGQLHESQDSYLQGQTGRLSINPQGLIFRDLEWAQFRNGLAQKLSDTP